MRKYVLLSIIAILGLASGVEACGGAGRAGLFGRRRAAMMMGGGGGMMMSGGYGMMSSGGGCGSSEMMGGGSMMVSGAPMMMVNAPMPATRFVRVEEMVPVPTTTPAPVQAIPMPVSPISVSAFTKASPVKCDCGCVVTGSCDCTNCVNDLVKAVKSNSHSAVQDLVTSVNTQTAIDTLAQAVLQEQAAKNLYTSASR